MRILCFLGVNEVIEIAHHLVGRLLVHVHNLLKQLALLLNLRICIGNLVLLLQALLISTDLRKEFPLFQIFGLSAVQGENFVFDLLQVVVVCIFRVEVFARLVVDALHKLAPTSLFLYQALYGLVPIVVLGVELNVTLSLEALVRVVGSPIALVDFGEALLANDVIASYTHQELHSLLRLLL